ncbi:MAG: hypothetical protein ACE5JQ_03755 [Candidatus Methylomirabilales bacterium]
MRVMRQAAKIICLLLILLSPTLSVVQETKGRFSLHHLRWAANIEMMKGHLTASLENLRLGEEAMALVHASHPVAEHFDLVAPPLRARSPGFETRARTVLIGLQEQLDRGLQAVEYERVLAQVFDVLDQALDVLIPPDILAEAGFQAAIIAQLCQTASQEYRVGVREGRVATLVEYQDAFGFVQRAQILAERLKEQIPAAVFDPLTQMARALPSVRPPQRPVPPAKVAATAGRLAQALEAVAGRRLIAEVVPGREIGAVRDLLAQIRRAYRKGEVKRAMELTASMYLDHFEKIEGDLIDKAPELNAKLEPVLGVKIRQLIKAQAPPGEVEALIAEALPALAEAEAALTSR